MAVEERFAVETRAQWRRWLAAHHSSAPGVWVVTWRRGSGRPIVPYEDLVEEALCFGWVDSRGGRVDDERTSLLMTPRNPRSRWSRPNKERIERLTVAGAMTPAGLAAVEEAKRRGTWTALDDVEDLVVPPDLAAALDAAPPARRHWDAFPRSVKRAILEWVSSATKPDTRAKRIAETATLAARNERANQWRPRPAPPPHPHP